MNEPPNNPLQQTAAAMLVSRSTPSPSAAAAAELVRYVAGAKMIADDFEKQPRGPYRFDYWLSKQPISTPMGDFIAEVREPPDGELLKQVNILAAFLQSNIEEVWDKVYEHYQRVAADRHWMKSCGVPTRLDRNGILRYLRSRQIVVERDGGVDGVIFIDPLWDVEHKIHLRLEDGVLSFSDW
jgi:hypothetical protein